MEVPSTLRRGAVALALPGNRDASVVSDLRPGAARWVDDLACELAAFSSQPGTDFIGVRSQQRVAVEL